MLDTFIVFNKSISCCGSLNSALFLFIRSLIISATDATFSGVTLICSELVVLETC